MWLKGWLDGWMGEFECCFPASIYVCLDKYRDWGIAN